MDSINPSRPAVLRYRNADFAIVKHGDFVVCAVTGRRIPLNALRYWSVERQEPYADAAAATARWKELREQGENSR